MDGEYETKDLRTVYREKKRIFGVYSIRWTVEKTIALSFRNKYNSILI